MSFKSLLEHSAKEVEYYLNLMLQNASLLAISFAKKMQEQGFGRIVNVASLAAFLL